MNINYLDCSTNCLSQGQAVTKRPLTSDCLSAPPRLLNLSLGSDLVPEQDVIDVIIHVGRNPQGRNLAWKYFREKWDVLNAR